MFSSGMKMIMKAALKHVKILTLCYGY